MNNAEILLNTDSSRNKICIFAIRNPCWIPTVTVRLRTNTSITVRHYITHGPPLHHSRSAITSLTVRHRIVRTAPAWGQRQAVRHRMRTKADSNDRSMQTESPEVWKNDLMRFEKIYIEGLQTINNSHSSK